MMLVDEELTLLDNVLQVKENEPFLLNLHRGDRKRVREIHSDSLQQRLWSQAAREHCQ